MSNNETSLIISQLSNITVIHAPVTTTYYRYICRPLSRLYLTDSVEISDKIKSHTRLT